jgi:HAD superfamily hydrolase (TIGR01509 family)
MSSERAPFAALDDILVQVHCLLLDLDGTICTLFAGTSTGSTADRLRKVLAREPVRLPQTIEDTADGFEILKFAASINPDLAARVEAELTEIELAAVPTAEPTAYIHDVIAACRESARSAAVVSNNSAACVHAYLERHGLTREIAVVAARTGHDPAVLKPSRHLIDQAANTLGAVPSGCAMIGDSPDDIQAAHAAGAHSIGYATSPARAGHLTTAGADAVLFSMADLALRLRARPANPDLLQLPVRLDHPRQSIGTYQEYVSGLTRIFEKAFTAASATRCISHTYRTSSYSSVSHAIDLHAARAAQVMKVGTPTPMRYIAQSSRRCRVKEIFGSSKSK